MKFKFNYVILKISRHITTDGYRINVMNRSFSRRLGVLPLTLLVVAAIVGGVGVGAAAATTYNGPDFSTSPSSITAGATTNIVLADAQSSNWNYGGGEISNCGTSCSFTYEGCPNWRVHLLLGLSNQSDQSERRGIRPWQRQSGRDLRFDISSIRRRPVVWRGLDADDRPGLRSSAEHHRLGHTRRPVRDRDWSARSRSRLASGPGPTPGSQSLEHRPPTVPPHRLGRTPSTLRVGTLRQLHPRIRHRRAGLHHHVLCSHSVREHHSSQHRA